MSYTESLKIKPSHTHSNTDHWPDNASNSSDCDASCPLCLEPFDVTDRHFKPCKCCYQICCWCWNQIMEKGDKRCPNCRKEYDSKNFDFTPPDPEDIKKEKQQKSKKKTHLSRKQLANVRVIQRNLVYAVGLTLNVAKEDFLRSSVNFAKYGKISKIVINKSNLQNTAKLGNIRTPTVSAYITYERSEDALSAIQAVDGTRLDGKVIRASFGTTKYCAYFLRGTTCTNPECMYLHDFGNDDDTFNKEDIVLKNGLPVPTNASKFPHLYPPVNNNVEKHVWKNLPAQVNAALTNTFPYYSKEYSETDEYDDYENERSLHEGDEEEEEEDEEEEENNSEGNSYSAAARSPIPSAWDTSYLSKIKSSTTQKSIQKDEIINPTIKTSTTPITAATANTTMAALPLSSSPSPTKSPSNNTVVGGNNTSATSQQKKPVQEKQVIEPKKKNKKTKKKKINQKIPTASQSKDIHEEPGSDNTSVITTDSNNHHRTESASSTSPFPEIIDNGTRESPGSNILDKKTNFEDSGDNVNSVLQSMIHLNIPQDPKEEESDKQISQQQSENHPAHHNFYNYQPGPNPNEDNAENITTSSDYEGISQWDDAIVVPQTKRTKSRFHFANNDPNHYSNQQPPSQSQQYPKIDNPQGNSFQSFNPQDLQQSFRALLPNVNISFTSLPNNLQQQQQGIWKSNKNFSNLDNMNGNGQTSKFFGYQQMGSEENANNFNNNSNNNNNSGNNDGSSSNKNMGNKNYHPPPYGEVYSQNSMFGNCWVQQHQAPPNNSQNLLSFFASQPQQPIPEAHQHQFFNQFHNAGKPYNAW